MGQESVPIQQGGTLPRPATCESAKSAGALADLAKQPPAASLPRS